ncbi:hypothetical protein PAEPH01_0276 [Pancytospora epiphaga]|nr:hypothetical protein PAEPH01_0276 [Pancytospora epiphaga]
MADISEIIKHFDLTVTVRELVRRIEITGSNKTNDIIEDLPSNDNSIVNTTTHPAWSTDILPATKYSIADDMKSLSKREELSKITIKNLKPGKLAMMIHCTDLLLIRNVSASDLVLYDGTYIPQSLSYILNKNTGILNWLGANVDTKYLFRMMTHAVLLKNYNLLHILIEASQRNKLDRKGLKKLMTYKCMCDRIDGGVFPFEWLLKDCADSNVNVASDIASMRFCKIVDCLKEMKEIVIPKNISEKQKYLVYANAWKYLHENVEKMEEFEGRFEKLYLLL